ncbi:NAD(P)-dependent oxidoreductase [Nonomuraea turkmeniaca]|uniref:NAD(P)-dependent oxidoreductase n=1 Tax=Nonomuraea turkmeniaca TaxID=103838 RepID=A0A5S4FUM2_9ACTN|nr:NAD(P)-dependent oxidoreductase [Nonomuraea turkmeniaca]TMR23821.1 NAD(P)-dependent oxidoreductase [Nonomuraea turkmeniaca]
MKRVLVTGAAGRIGRALLDLLEQQGIPANVLVLENPGDLKADLVVEGTATDPHAVRAALAGVEAVIHLAAIPSPERHPAEEVFATNTQATYTVLEQAGRAGIMRACTASSTAISGLPFAARALHPPYAPVDEEQPPLPEDPYALSKQVDELTAHMMTRRHGMSVAALRLPYVGGFDERLLDFAGRCELDPGLHAAGLWAYLETRDAARACLLGLGLDGFHVITVAAPETLVSHPTEDLLRRFHPTTDIRRPLPGRTVPLDLTKATALLGFSAEFRV